MAPTNYSVATKYQTDQVTHADPVQIIVLLYDGALSRIAQAKHRYEAKDTVYGSINVVRAQAIVNELRKSLNLAQGGEIAENLERIYSYITYVLLVAVLRENRVAPLDEAARLLTELKEAWAEVAKQNKTVLAQPQSPSQFQPRSEPQPQLQRAMIANAFTTGASMSSLQVKA